MLPRLVTLLLLPLLFGCRPATLPPVATEPPPVNLPASVQQLTPDQTAALMQSTPDLVIVDLREGWELKAEGIIAGSQHIDYLNSKLFEESIARLDPAKSYLLYCAIGGRSRLAAAAMSGKGFTHLALMAGGTDAWLKAGKTLVK